MIRIPVAVLMTALFFVWTVTSAVGLLERAPMVEPGTALMLGLTYAAAVAVGIVGLGATWVRACGDAGR